MGESVMRATAILTTGNASLLPTAASPPLLFPNYLMPSLPFRKHRQRLFPHQQDRDCFGRTTSYSTSPSSSSASSSPPSSSHLQPELDAALHSNTYPLSSSYSSNEDSHEALHASSTNTSNNTTDGGTVDDEPDLTDGFLAGHTSHIACARCHADLALTSQIISKGFTGRHGRAYLVAATTSPLTSGPTLSSASIGLTNTNTHKPVPRHLVTGLHTVCDISCALCDTILGWKYVSAEDEGQRYKVGKFILETRRVIVGSCWENYDKEDNESGDEDAVVELSGPSSRPGMLARQRAMRSNLHGTVLTSSTATTPVAGSAASASIPGTPGGAGGSPVGFSTTQGSRAANRARTPAVPEEDILFDSQDEDECEDLFSGVWSPQLARRRRWRKKNLRG